VGPNNAAIFFQFSAPLVATISRKRSSSSVDHFPPAGAFREDVFFCRLKLPEQTLSNSTRFVQLLSTLSEPALDEDDDDDDALMIDGNVKIRSALWGGNRTIHD
jgi:hypothetical protein